MDRRIILQGVQNARDLGGLKTADGRAIASGILIRSANLAEATAEDEMALREKYRLSMVIDLRTGQERNEKPDATVEGVEYRSIPIFDESVAGISHEKRQGLSAIPNMEQLYRDMMTVKEYRRNLGKAAVCVMEHDFAVGSVLWHCTEGKDRCGLLTTILLSALGVDRDTIMEDYLLTNEVNGPKAERFYQLVLSKGGTDAEAHAVRKAFLADKAYLSAAFSAVDEQYEGRDAFLHEGLGIPQATIDNFRESVLQ